MKHPHYLMAGAIMALAMMATSCSDSDDKEIDSGVTIKFNFDRSNFKSTGEWNHCYDPSYDNRLTIDRLTFGRTASATEWGGITYYSWKGFTPSISTDNTDHAGEWVTYQWGAITGQAAYGNAYMLGCWDSQEVVTEAPDYVVPSSQSVKITAKEAFTPKTATITNACYTYYVMQSGDDFCKKFTSQDWLKLNIHGLRNGNLTGSLTVDMATGTDALRSWKTVDLSSLGTVDCIYFQMQSSDSGQWGMNTPAYFCLGSLSIE